MARLPKGPKLTRRSVLKGLGALAADAAMGFPRIRSAPRKAARVLELTPPWIKKMVSVLTDTYAGHRLDGINVLTHGESVIRHLSSPDPKKALDWKAGQTFEIKTRNGQTELVTMKETAGDIELRWEDANGERQDRVITIDKKDGKTELINERETWEDAPDPTATYEESDKWNISRDNLRENMILDGSFKKLDDVDPQMYDEESVYFPDAGVEADELEQFFEKYVDSFSPSGPIFQTAERSAANLKRQKEMKRKYESLDRINKKSIQDQSEMDWENQFRGGYGMHSYNTGGEVYGTMKDVVPPLDARQAYPRGGSVFKKTKLPKPVTKVESGQQRIAAPKRTGRGPDLKPIRTDIYEAPPGPYTITDASGVRILDKDFTDLAEAQKSLDELATLRTTDPTEFQIVGARPPKTAEGVWESAPTVKSKKEQKQLITEKQFDEMREPAMFWKSRELIAQSPMGAMKGEQWLRYLKNKGVGESELVDTSLGFHLSQQAGMKVNKADLLKDFDKISPKIEAKMQGFRDNNSAIKRVKSYLKKLKERPPINMTTPVRNVIAHLEKTLGGMDLERSANAGDNAKSLEKAADDAFAREFGLDGISSIHPDTKIDFLAKKIGMMLDDAVNMQGMQYKVSKKPGYAGSQVLPGGYNYNEIVFTFKPGQYRLDEPKFSSGHFGETKNLFVWVRTSDRVDEMGRRFIFIEEIQSDMHQSARGKSGEGGRSGKGYRPRPDAYDESSVARAGNEARLDEIQNQIDDILEGNLNQSGKSLDELRLEQEAIIKGFQEMGETRSSRYKSSSSIPEGPFPDSKDYGKFVVQYLLRLAKENDYNGVALSSNRIKNRQEGHGGMGIEAMEAGKHTGFYKNIMIPQMRKISRKSGAKFEDDIVIVDSNGVVWDKIPALIVKDERGIVESAKKMDKGISAYATGGLVRSAFNSVVPPLNPGVL